MSLRLENISHAYDRAPVLTDASVTVSAGEILCLFGPSGCGKTTLLRIAAGLEPLQAGSVSIDGAVIASNAHNTPVQARPIGMVFQDFVLFPHLSVEKNVAYGLKGQPDAKAVVARQLDALGLAPLAKRYPRQLSGGQQQRVALARALVRAPKALLLDEPFASIDAVLRRQLREELRRILKQQNVAVVMVTHDPEEALSIGDRIAMMRMGRVVETATAHELFTAPTTPEGAGIFPGCQRLSGAIKAGVMMTPLGALPANTIADGPGIAILRKGALSARVDQAGAFTAADIRFTGPHWQVLLNPQSRGDSTPHNATQISVEMTTPPQLGDAINIDINTDHVFVFAG